MRGLEKLAIVFVAVGAALAAAGARAEVRLPNLLTDHAVLQRQAPIHIWGDADPGETVTVRFHDQTSTATASDIGEWELWLKPEQAGGPYTLTAQGSSTVTVTDLLMGDVWVASGQSNMEMPLKGFNNAPLKNGAQEIAKANLPTMRLLIVNRKPSDYPLNNITSSWTECTPQTAADFSAVAYFFGREINAKERVPIGLIDSTWGGTPVESWISLEGLSSDAGLMPLFASRAKFASDVAVVPQMQAREKREAAAAIAAHTPPPNPVYHPMEGSWMPAGLFNGMIAPLVPYTIKGVIWYQGETNSNPERAPMYVKAFPAMIADWRKQWRQGDFPFLYAQISNFESPAEDWGTIRDAQRRTLTVANTAMAVTLDLGQKDNVHPPDKQTVGGRMAQAALVMVYGGHGEYDGPLFRQATFEGAAIRVWFDHAQGGLASHGEPAGFEIAGGDGKFVPAKAKIEGSTVVVEADGVSHPRTVRYGWASWTDANLFSKENLPASAFSSN